MDSLNPTESTSPVAVQTPSSAPSQGAPDIQELNVRIAQKSQFVDLLRSEMARTIVGQSDMVDRLLIGLLANGHVLLEGVPGLAKTLAIRSLSDTVAGEFSRIQFTPDLLPADVVGTLVYNPQSQEFTVKRAPSSPILSWRMKSTAHPPRCKAPCSRRCRNVK